MQDATPLIPARGNVIAKSFLIFKFIAPNLRKIMAKLTPVEFWKAQFDLGGNLAGIWASVALDLLTAADVLDRFKGDLRSHLAPVHGRAPWGLPERQGRETATRSDSGEPAEPRHASKRVPFPPPVSPGHAGVRGGRATTT